MNTEVYRTEDSRERQLSGQSLTEQATQRIEGELQEFFNQVDSPIQVRVRDLPGMLESSSLSVAHALDALAFSPETSYASYRQSIHNRSAVTYPKTVEPKLKHLLSRAQVLELNRHPLIRTLSAKELALLLSVRITDINEVGAQDDIQPVKAANKDAKGRAKQYNRYNLDQIEEIKEGLKRFEAPQGYIGESSILGSIGVSAAVLGEIREKLKVEGQLFHNPEIGRGETFFQEKDVLRLLLFVKEYKRLHP